MFGLGRQKVAIATNPGFGSADLIGQTAMAFFAASPPGPSFSPTISLTLCSLPSASFDVPRPSSRNLRIWHKRF